MGRFSKRKPPQPRSRSVPLLLAFVGGVALTSLVAVLFARSDAGTRQATSGNPSTAACEEVIRWLRNESPDLSGAKTDIAVLNLACCADFGRKAGEPDTAAALAELDNWAGTIRRATARNYHRYLADPAEFGSEAGWKLAMMCTILGQDLRIRYDPELADKATQTSPNSVFFRDPSRVFLTGLLGKDRVGTCSSLPVLYVAPGRRLGYPLHLVCAKNHLFLRWDDGKGTKVNMEASCGGGFLSYPDDHYRKLRGGIRPEEEKAAGYLANLKPSETLAIFLTTRAVCLSVAGRHEDAYTAASQAHKPTNLPRSSPASPCALPKICPRKST